MSNLIVNNFKDILNENSRTFTERQKELEQIDQRNKEDQEREKYSPYSNWYQFNRDHSKAMIQLATKHPKAQAILLFLLEQMDNYNAVMCSYQVFQEALQISQVTVARSVKILKDQGFIAILKSGSSNVYIVNDDLAWSSWGKNKKYSKFPANIIISAEENIDYYIQKQNIKQINIKN